MTSKWFSLDDVNAFRSGLSSAEKNVDEVGNDDLETSSDSGVRDEDGDVQLRDVLCPPTNPGISLGKKELLFDTGPLAKNKVKDVMVLQ